MEKNKLGIMVGEYFDLQKHIIMKMSESLENNNLEKADVLNNLLQINLSYD